MKSILTSLVLTVLTSSTVFAGATSANKTLADCQDMKTETIKSLNETVLPANAVQVQVNAMCLSMFGIAYYLVIDETRMANGKVGNIEYNADVKACVAQSNAAYGAKLLSLKVQKLCPDVLKSYPTIAPLKTVLAFMGIL